MSVAVSFFENVELGDDAMKVCATCQHVQEYL